MKNKKGIYFLALIGVFAFVSCKKYQDGPILSLRSKTNRLSNIWKVDNYKLNGTDLTSLMGGYSETFSKDAAYTYSWGAIDGSGNWDFQNKNEEIRITGSKNQNSVTLYILKLEEKQFWYYYMDGDDKKEFHMVEK